MGEAGVSDESSSSSSSSAPPSSSSPQKAYRELVVREGHTMNDIVEAIKDWRRPLQVKMRRPKQIRLSRRRNQVQKYTPTKTSARRKSKHSTSYGGRQMGKKLRKVDWYLVKWTNMSFRHVSWEKSDDLNDDMAIAKYRMYEQMPTQSRTDEKRQAEVKKSFRDNVKGSFVWETMDATTGSTYEDDDDADVAAVLADLVRRTACKPMLADGWSLTERNSSTSSTSSMSSSSWTYKNDSLGLTQYAAPLGRGVFHDYINSPTFKNGLALRSYQVEGLNWLLRSWYAERGSILADEMGLGKTAQVISMLEHLAVHEDIRGPFLCVVPLSTIEHWRREIERWTDLKVCVYHDQEGAAGRQVIRENCWRYDSSNDHTISKFNVLVTTYETLLTDLNQVGEFKWRVMITDEGHKLKNPESKIALALSEGLSVEQHVLLTGTPIQNNTQELWALMSFVQGKENFMYHLF